MKATLAEVICCRFPLVLFGTGQKARITMELTRAPFSEMKTVEHREVLRGFESLSLRQISLAQGNLNRLNVVIKGGSASASVLFHPCDILVHPALQEFFAL